MIKPKISVIIAVYNSERYLDKCIESIRNQKYQNLEIILVNDGSDDRSGTICDDYAAKDKRIRVVHKPHGGMASARNLGIDIASGEYIGFVDSDDCIKTGMYDGLFTSLKMYSADISRCGIEIADGSRHISCGIFTEAPYEMYVNEMIYAISVDAGILETSPCNKLFKTEILENVRFDEALADEEDMLFVYRASLNAKRMVCYDEFNYIHNVRKESLSQIRKNNVYVIPAMRIIADEQISNRLIYKHCVYGKVIKAFRIIRRMKLTGNYDEFKNIRKIILGHKTTVLFNSECSAKTKMKILMLWFMPFVYR